MKPEAAFCSCPNLKVGSERRSVVEQLQQHVREMKLQLTHTHTHTHTHLPGLLWLWSNPTLDRWQPVVGHHIGPDSLLLHRGSILLGLVRLPWDLPCALPAFPVVASPELACPASHPHTEEETGETGLVFMELLRQSVSCVTFIKTPGLFICLRKGPHHLPLFSDQSVFIYLPLVMTRCSPACLITRERHILGFLLLLQQ